MPKPFYKHKILLDEHLHPRRAYLLLNEYFDLKHIKDDLHHGGMDDGRENPVKPFVDSTAVIGDAAQLMQHMRRGGYLFLRGLLPVARFVRYVPFLSHAELIPLYGAAEAFVLPTIHEGFSFTILEALACGCPVVTFPHAALEGGVERAVYLAAQPDVAALAAALGGVAANANLRAELRDRGLACAARFSWRRNAEETLRLLEEVAGSEK